MKDKQEFNNYKQEMHNTKDNKVEEIKNDKVLEIAEEILKKHIEAFKELAK